MILGNAKNTCLNLAVDGSTANYIVKNNILDGGGAGDPRTTHSHNIYTGLRWNQDESDLDPTESVVENLDLLFVNPGANDFRLKEGSPAIDAGTTITYNEDIEGNSRPQGGAFDIGAYESGGGSTQPAVTVSIGAPSVSRTKSGPVTFLVTYTDADSITLAPGDVSLNATGTASATVGVSGSGNTRTVTLSNTTGSGALAISLAAGTASNSAGPAPAAGPSSPVVVDNTPPVLSLVGSATVVVGIGDAFTDPGATATDNVDGNLTGAITVEGSVNTAVVGSYSLVYRVQDQVGNSASPVTRTVNVVDDIPPSITLSGANPLYLSVGQAYSEPGYSATDNVDGNLTGQVVVSGSVNTSVPGSYTRTYSVSDAAGNNASKVRSVVVSAAPVNNAPTLNAPAAVSACENEDICVMMSVSDADGDSVEVMADISGLPEGAVTTLTDEGDGTCHFDWTPAEGMAGTFTVTFTACDDREPPATCSAVTTITVDPAPVVPVVQFASDFASVEEAAGLAQVQLELSVPVPEGQTVEIELAYGAVDAEHGKDFEFLVSGLTAEAGQQTLTFDIPILDDVEVEGNESLDISIVAVVNGEVGSTALMTVQILDDDFGDACDTGYHSADFSQDYDIDLSELLRCVQLYRYGAYHVDSRTEDGYAPGAGSQDGCPHSGDYQGGADWRITLSELLRLIELFSASGGYDVCPDSEDGFCRR